MTTSGGSNSSSATASSSSNNTPPPAEAPSYLSPEGRSFQRSIQALEEQVKSYNRERSGLAVKRDELRNGLARVEADLAERDDKIKRCEDHIASLRPMFQVFLEQANEKRRQELAKQRAAAAAANGGEDGEHNGVKECSICLMELEQEVAYALPCGHVFHRVCVKNWLARSSLCPICKQDVTRFA